MGLFRRRAPKDTIRIHPDNASSSDWVVVLEGNTIIGPSPDRLRVAKATLERKVVKRFNVLLQASHFLVVEGFDPRIHAVFFCPQLYKYDPDKKLVPLDGDEIGSLIARAVESGIAERKPWYSPGLGLPECPVVDYPRTMEFDTLVVETPEPTSAGSNVREATRKR